MNIAALERELLSVWKTWQLRVDRETSTLGDCIFLSLAEPPVQTNQPREQGEEDEDEGMCLEIDGATAIPSQLVSAETSKEILLAHICGQSDEVFDKLDAIVTRHFSLTGVKIETGEDNPPQEVSEINFDEILLTISDSISADGFHLNGSNGDLGDLSKPLLRRLQAASRNP